MLMHRGIFCSLVVLVLGLAVPAQSVREIRLPVESGKLSVLKLTRALLTEYGYSGEHLNFPDVKVNIKGVKGSLMLKGMSVALGGTARLQKVDGGKSLMVTIDPARARVMRHLVKERFGKLVSRMVGQDILARHYALEVPEDLGVAESFVLCVHGLDSSGRAFRDLRACLGQGEEKVRSGTFAYANDEAVDRIAQELASRLKRRAKRFPEQKIILVVHSMGGLVARYMLETKALDPGNVTTLIMIGVPNHGSRLSRLRSGIDLLEFFAIRATSRGCWRRCSTGWARLVGISGPSRRFWPRSTASRGTPLSATTRSSATGG
jgi:PGAP1-like protein